MNLFGRSQSKRSRHAVTSRICCIIYIRIVYTHREDFAFAAAKSKWGPASRRNAKAEKSGDWDYVRFADLLQFKYVPVPPIYS